jgi:hypothetical protein
MIIVLSFNLAVYQLDKFLLFEKNLLTLSTFASRLPQNLCAKNDLAAQFSTEPVTTVSHSKKNDSSNKTTIDHFSRTVQYLYHISVFGSLVQLSVEYLSALLLFVKFSLANYFARIKAAT